jgi:hypothetical protein
MQHGSRPFASAFRRHVRHAPLPHSELLSRQRGARRLRRTSLLVAVTATSPLAAAGLEDPSLHTARYQGLAGTAIGFVADPSAVFHNPAGLSGIAHVELLGAIGVAKPQAVGAPSPTVSAATADSPTMVPFLFGAGVRLSPWVSVGAAFYPLTAGRLTYNYPTGFSDLTVADSSSIRLTEAAPAISVQVPDGEWLPGKLSFGLAYRVTTLDWQRSADVSQGTRLAGLDLSTRSWRGVRIGAQYAPSPLWAFGLVFKNRVNLEAEAKSGIVGQRALQNPQLSFVLPARLGLGARVGNSRVAGSSDVEYSFGSAADANVLQGILPNGAFRSATPLGWSNFWTVRFGLELGLGASEQFPLRFGYFRDGQTTSRRYPSAFLPPPNATHGLSIGAGYAAETWSINAAWLERFGFAEVTANQIAPPDACQNCGSVGGYGLSVAEFLLDASIEFGP